MPATTTATNSYDSGDRSVGHMKIKQEAITFRNRFRKRKDTPIDYSYSSRPSALLAGARQC